MRFDPGVETSAKKWKTNTVRVKPGAREINHRYIALAARESGGEKEKAERLEP